MNSIQKIMKNGEIKFYGSVYSFSSCSNKFPQLVVLNNRNLFSLYPGGQSPPIRLCLTGSVPGPAVTVSCLSPSLWWFLAAVAAPGLCLHLQVVFLWVFSAQIFFSLIKTQSLDLSPEMISSGDP